MALSWKKIEDSDDYQSRSDQEKQAIRSDFFSTFIAVDPEYKSLDPTEQQEIQSKFIFQGKPRITRPTQPIEISDSDRLLTGLIGADKVIKGELPPQVAELPPADLGNLLFNLEAKKQFANIIEPQLRTGALPVAGPGLKALELGKTAVHGIKDIARGVQLSATRFTPEEAEAIERKSRYTAIPLSPTELIEVGELQKAGMSLKDARLGVRRKSQENLVNITQQFIDNIDKDVRLQQYANEGWTYRAAKGMARFAPIVMSGALPGGLAVAPALTFAAIWGGEYEQLTDNDVPHQLAADAAFISAAGSTPLEYAGNLFQIGLLRRFFRTLKIKGPKGKALIPSAKIIDLFKNLGKGGFFEGMEESLQAYPELLGRIYALNPKATNEEISAKFKELITNKKFIAEQVEGGLLGATGGSMLAGFMSAATMGAEQLQMYRIKKFDEKELKQFQKEMEQYAAEIREDEGLVSPAPGVEPESREVKGREDLQRKPKDERAKAAPWKAEVKKEKAPVKIEDLTITDKIIDAFAKNQAAVKGIVSFLRENMGMKQWDEMTPAEKLKETRDHIKRDIEQVKKEIVGRDPIEYLADRALDPLDPLNEFYSEILRRMGHKVKAGKRSEQVKTEAGIKPEKKVAAKPGELGNVRTIRGAIRKLGGIDFLHFKGELKEMDLSVKYLKKTGGMPIDIMENALKDEGFLYPEETLLDVLRDSKNLSRDRISADVLGKREHELSDQERKIRAEIKREPEAPPMGKYVTMKAEDIPEGIQLAIIEGKSTEGWDFYEVKEKDPFGVKLIDGQEIELKPFDKVQVLQPDIGEAKPIKAVAIKTADGQIIKGEAGQLHVDVFQKLTPEQKENLPHENLGFINQEGEFLTRKEASKLYSEYETLAMKRKGIVEKTGKPKLVLTREREVSEAEARLKRKGREMPKPKQATLTTEFERAADKKEGFFRGEKLTPQEAKRIKALTEANIEARAEEIVAQKKTDVQYKEEVEIAETGEVIETTRDAADALRETESELSVYRKLRDCMKKT